MSPNPDFSQKWRKQQACDRCRRFKVRCQYESPDDLSCIRCTKANADCKNTHSPNDNSKVGNVSRKKQKVNNNVNVNSSSNNNSNATTSPNSISSYSTNSASSPPAHSCDDCSVQKRPVINHEERVERINILERRIQHANDEISMLKSLDFYTDRGMLLSTQLKFKQQQARNELSPPSIAISVNPPIVLHPKDNTGDGILTKTTWLPPVRVTCHNCVDLAVKYGFYTELELLNFFDLYVTDLALYIPFPIDDRLPFTEMKKVSPLLTIAAVTCSAVCSTIDKAKERIAYLERVIAEAIFIERDLSLELQMVLIMMTVFVSPKLDRQAPFQLLTSLAVSLSLDLGSDEDIEILNDVNSDPEQVKLAFKRTRSYISLCTCIAGMALNSARQRLLQVMSHCERCCDAILARAPDYDKPIVYLLKMMLYYNSSIEKLRDPYEPFSSLLNHYETTREGLQTLFNECEATCLEWLDKRYIIPIRSSFYILLQSLNEVMLSRLAMLDTNEPQFRQLWYRFAEEIKKIARVIIDGFLEVSKFNSRIPNFMYFRPLHSLTSLIRLRLISWTMRLDIEIDVEGAFNLVKSAWVELKKTSFVALQLYVFLSKVETWLNIKLGHSNPQDAEFIKAATGGSRSTIDTLYRIMKQFITTNDSMYSKKKRQNSLQSSAATTSSPTPIPPESSQPIAAQPVQPIQTSRSFPLSNPFQQIPPLTMMKPKQEYDSNQVLMMSNTSSTIPLSQSQQLPSSQPQQTSPQSQSSGGLSRSTTSTTLSTNTTTATSTSTSTTNPAPFQNLFIPPYDVKDPPVVDNMLPMMYVDEESTFPGQQNDIEFLLKELFNEVTSASI